MTIWETIARIAGAWAVYWPFVIAVAFGTLRIEQWLEKRRAKR